MPLFGWKTPESISELRRFLGMTNQLNKFSPFIADRTKPLRNLLVKNTEWWWGHQQAALFGEIKKELSSSRTLGQHNPNSKTVIAADASSFGLGAVIFQQQRNGDWMPIAYASRALTATIEKEALAITWACERFNDYVLGMKFHIQTDHKPLLSLLGNRNLDDLPARIQRFRMWMMKYHYTIEHVTGKELVIANTLLRVPVSKPTAEDITFGEQVYADVSQVFESLPATSDPLKQIKVTQEKDKDIQLLRKYLINGWPDKKLLSQELKLYHNIAVELTEVNGIILWGNRILIPRELRSEMLTKLHTGHLGIFKCRERARQSMWWPGMSTEIGEMIQKCDICNKHKPQRPKPLISSEFLELPWQKLGTDLFTWKGFNYLLVIDYYSRDIEI